MPETVEVPTQVEMREILDLAIEKRSRAFGRQAERMDYVRPAKGNEFVEQLKMLPETEILKRIRSMGRWRVWIRPTVFEKGRFQTLTQCRLFVTNNAVRRLDVEYPVVFDERITEGDECISTELEVGPHLESWSLFRSGQFVHNIARAEEFFGTPAWPVHPQFFLLEKGRKYLHIWRTLGIVSGIYEFAARMAARQLLDPEASISIELYGLDGRELSFMEPKHRLDEKYWCRTEDIRIEKILKPEELSAKASELALDVTIEIFTKFGWKNPPRSLLAQEQTR
jgi:hypothetical protein